MALGPRHLLTYTDAEAVDALGNTHAGAVAGAQQKECASWRARARERERAVVGGHGADMEEDDLQQTYDVSIRQHTSRKRQHKPAYFAQGATMEVDDLQQTSEAYAERIAAGRDTLLVEVC